MEALAGIAVVAVLLWIIVRRSSKKPSEGNRVFFQQVHGIFHKNVDGSSRQEIIRRCWVGEEVVLVPETANRFDPYAIKVCRSDGGQIGYLPAGNHIAADLDRGWTFRATIEEIYPFEENVRRHGVLLRIEVLTMSRQTEERKKRAAARR